MDFAAKVRWYMANDAGELLPLLQDKYRVKEIARSRGVDTAKLLYVTDNPSTIPFAELPPDCVIKANHGSGWNILRKNSQLFRFSTGHNVLGEDGQLRAEEYLAPLRLSQAECVAQCDDWLNLKYSIDERSYHRIAPRIIVEEMLQSCASGEIKDYRFYTFNGEVRAINVGSPTYRRLNENVFFTPQWQEISLTVYKENRPEVLPSKPEKLEEMIACAGLMGRGLNFVRVDLYDTNRGVVFGELTFYPHGGTPNTPTACRRFNSWLAQDWPLEGRRVEVANYCNWECSPESSPLKSAP